MFDSRKCANPQASRLVRYANCTRVSNILFISANFFPYNLVAHSDYKQNEQQGLQDYKVWLQGLKEVDLVVTHVKNGFI